MTVGSADDPVGDAEAVFLAVPLERVDGALAGLGDLDGRVLVDCTNPVTYGPTGMAQAIVANTSASAIIAEKLPKARIVKTLNQVGAGVLADPGSLGPVPMMGLARDDDEAKARIGEVLGAFGFDVFDPGGLKNAHLLEAFALLWMSQAFSSGDPAGIAFGRASRPM